MSVGVSVAVGVDETVGVLDGVIKGVGVGPIVIALNKSSPNRTTSKVNIANRARIPQRRM